ncbi:MULTISPECIES: ABC transporter substrate-binding protein [unclassified Inquilinus]|uniref:ABC transporter substrate-binding protein n=1 Tax=unclassified Inquilinus TaxID=2645927 RepID=UPI003F8EB132
MIRGLLPALGLAAALLAQPAAAQQQAAPKLSVTIGYLGEAIPEPEPLSLVEPVAKDKGVAGARLAIVDDQTTGRFLGHDYALDETIIPAGGDLAGAASAMAGKGVRLVIADLPADRLLQLADQPELKDAVIFNARAEDDRLRIADCRANLFHTMPSRAMKADALAQYLAFKRWTRWVLVSGTQDGDKAFADAIRRSAKRYGAQIVEERSYEFQAGSRRSDTGEQQVQRQMTQLTQRLPDYDVLVVADESEVFGEYLPYRTWDARPVVGTQGLVPTAWHRSQEQWGGTQLQRRFQKAAGRWMLERDYAAWVAVRTVGEAVTRTGTADPAAIRAYLVSDDFQLGAFKGVPLTFRRWDQQLRQPIVLASPLMLVSVSPQDGFLHQRTPLDTLGYDEPESACRLNPDP